jgi:hypothetical protein
MLRDSIIHTNVTHSPAPAQNLPPVEKYEKQFFGYYHECSLRLPAPVKIATLNYTA